MVSILILLTQVPNLIGTLTPYVYDVLSNFKSKLI